MEFRSAKETKRWGISIWKKWGVLIVWDLKQKQNGLVVSEKNGEKGVLYFCKKNKVIQLFGWNKKADCAAAEKIVNAIKGKKYNSLIWQNDI